MISSVDATSVSSTTPYGSASMTLDQNGFLYIASRLTPFGMLKISVQDYQLVCVTAILPNNVIRSTYSKGNTNCLLIGSQSGQNSGIIDSTTGAYVSTINLGGIWSIKSFGNENKYFSIGQFGSSGSTSNPNTLIIVDYSDPCNIVQVQSLDQINNGQNEVINYKSLLLVSSQTSNTYTIYSLEGILYSTELIIIK